MADLFTVSDVALKAGEPWGYALVIATLTDLNGNPVTNGHLTGQPGTPVQSHRMHADPVTGEFELHLWANDDITPANTYYTVRIGSGSTLIDVTMDGTLAQLEATAPGDLEEGAASTAALAAEAAIRAAADADLQDQIDNIGPGGGAVDSVNGETGAVVLSASDVGALPDTGGEVTGPVTLSDAGQTRIELDPATGLITIRNAANAVIATIGDNEDGDLKITATERVDFLSYNGDGILFQGGQVGGGLYRYDPVDDVSSAIEVETNPVLGNRTRIRTETYDDTGQSYVETSPGIARFIVQGAFDGFQEHTLELHADDGLAYLDGVAIATVDDVTSVTAALAAHVAAADPHAQYQKESEKDQANGYAGLDGSGLVPDNKIAATIARDSEVSAGDAASVATAAADATTKANAAQSAAIAAAATDATTKVSDERELTTPVRARGWSTAWFNAIANGGGYGVFVGDSTVQPWSDYAANQWQSYAERLLDTLAIQFNNGLQPPDPFRGPQQIIGSDVHAGFTTPGGVAGNHGLGGWGSTLTSGQYSEHLNTWGNGFFGDAIDFYFTKSKATTGTAEVYVDGVLKATVSMLDNTLTPAEKSGYRTRVTGLTMGVHTVKVLCTAGTVKFDGCQAHVGTTTAGALFEIGAHAGSAIADHQNTYGTLDHIDKNRPDLVVIGNGLVDYNNANSYISALTSFIDAIQALYSPSILIVHQYEPAAGFTGFGAATLEPARALAKTKGCGFVSNFEAQNSAPMSNSFLIDTVHANSAGNQIQHDVVAPYIVGAIPRPTGTKRTDSPLWVYTPGGAAVKIDAGGIYGYSSEANRIAGDDSYNIGLLGGVGLMGLGQGNGFIGVDANTVRVLNALSITGLTGGNSTGRYAGFRNTTGPPSTGTWETGDVVCATDGDYRCSASGSPGTWVHTTWSLIDAKGDIIAGTADNTAARLAVGANGRVLEADSGQTPGLKWGIKAKGLNALGPAGCVSETIPRQAIVPGNLAPLTSGQIYCAAITLNEGDVVTNLTWISRTTAAVNPTNWWFALLDPSRLVVRYTADQTTTAWAGSTSKTLALTSSYTVPATGTYYMALMMAAATPISLAGISGASALFAGIAPIIVGAPASGNGSSGLTTPASLGTAGSVTVGALTAASTGQPYAYAT